MLDTCKMWATMKKEEQTCYNIEVYGKIQAGNIV